jgi:hypothetical protein
MQGVNQVRQFYVTAGSDTASDVVKSAALDPDSAALGTVFVKSVKSPIGDAKAAIVQHMGQGGLVVSDLINSSQIVSIKATKASAMARSLKQAVIVLNSSINSGAPVAGQDYVVDIQVSNYISLADESVLVKFGAVHATSGMSASDFYLALANSFARNFSRDINKFFKIYLTKEASSHGSVSSTWVEATGKTTGTDFTGIIISELPQTADYVLGEVPVKTVNFKVIPHTILASGEEINPFVVNSDGSVALMAKTSVSGSVTAIPNGYDVADLEWFCMGERGDQIRGIGYPRTIRTKYMVDPAKEYSMIDIVFYYQGSGVNVQKSQKQLTIAVPNGGAGHVYDVINALIGKFNTAFGTSVSTLS